MKKSNISRIADVSMTFLCLALFIAMLVQSLLYFANTKKISESDSVDLHSLLVLKSGESVDYGSQNYSQYLSPEFIGVRHAGAQKGLSVGKDDVSTMCGLINPLIDLVTGEGFVCERLTTDPEQIWNSCFENEDFIYLKYYDDLLLQTLRFFAVWDGSTDFSNSCLGDTALVREMVLLPQSTLNGSFTVTAVVRSSDGTVARLTPSGSGNENYVSLSEIFNAISHSTYFYDFTFLKDTAYDYGLLSLPAYTAFSRDSIMTCSILRKLPEENYFAESAFSDTVLRLFSFNPDKLNIYTEQGGTVVCVENFGVFRADSMGKLDFLAGDQEGIHISEYLDYSNYDDSYDFYELTAASCAIIDKLRICSEDMFSGDADFCLYNISGNDDEITFTFIYTYDNLPIFNDEGEVALACKMSYSNGALVSFTANCTGYVSNSTYTDNYAQNWICTQYAHSIDRLLNAEMVLGYVPVSGQGDSFLSDWVFYTLF